MLRPRHLRIVAVSDVYTLDVDRDGKVTIQEIAAALVREHADASPLVAELVVHALDRDHDGSVSPGEDA